MFATLNTCCFAAFFLAYCGWGFLVCGRAGRTGWLPAVGIGCCSIVATALNGWGCPPAVNGWLIFGVGSLGAVAGCRRLLSRLRATPLLPPANLLSSPRANPNGSSLGIRIVIPLATSIAIPIAAALLIALPMAVGGAQFALFQGNINDQFNYLASAVVRTTESHRAVVSATSADFLRNPLLAIAHTMAGARPAVIDLYGCLEGLLPGNLHRCHYGFLCAFLLGTCLAVAECVRCLTGGGPWRCQLIGLACVVGFWGQLQIDLDSWSWAAATPLAAAAIGMMAGIPACATRIPGCATGIPGCATGTEPGPDVWRSRLALGLCAAGTACLYPEMFAFLAPAAGISVGVAAALGRYPRKACRDLGWGCLAAAALLAPGIGAITAFIAHQITFSSRADFAPLDWMWQSLVGGPLTGVSPIAALLRWIAGAAGLGMLLDEPFTRTAALLLAAAATASIACQARHIRRLPAPALTAVIAAGGVTLEAAGCIALGHRWIGAKALTYDSVLLLPLLLSPMAKGSLTLLRAPSWLLLAVQIAFGLFRPVAAADPDGIHYRATHYPAVMDPALKTVRSWNVGEGPRLLRPSRHVKIDVPDLWLETYAAICVQAQGLPYFKRLPVYVYLGVSNDSYGTQAQSPEYDSLVYFDYDRANGRAGLGFARRDGQVASTHTGPRITEIRSGSGLDTMNGLLSWRMRPTGAESVARLTVEQAGEESARGTAAFEVGIIAPKQDRAPLRLTIRSGAASREVSVAGNGSDVIQGVRVPLATLNGVDRIQLTLQSTAAGPADDTPVTLVNPRLYVVPHVRPQGPASSTESAQR